MEISFINTRFAGRAPVSRLHCLGLTVVELMIALSIVAILLTVGIPSYANLLQKNRISETSGLLHISLNMARGEAIKRRQPVQVCPSADGSSCRDDGEWSEGWLVFADANGNDTPDDGEIVRLVERLSEGISVQASAAVQDFLQFEPTGIVWGDGGVTGGFLICHADSGVHSNTVSVTPAGQVRTQRGSAEVCSG